MENNDFKDYRFIKKDEWECKITEETCIAPQMFWDGCEGCYISKKKEEYNEI